MIHFLGLASEICELLDNNFLPSAVFFFYSLRRLWKFAVVTLSLIHGLFHMTFLNLHLLTFFIFFTFNNICTW